MKSRSALWSVCCLAAAGGLVLAAPGPRRTENRLAKAPEPIDGLVTFDFSPTALDRFGLWFTPRGQIDPLSPDSAADAEPTGLVQHHISFHLDPASTMALNSSGTAPDGPGFNMFTCGALMLFPTEQRVVIGNLGIERDEMSGYRVLDRLDESHPATVFYLDTVSVGVDQGAGKEWLTGDVLVVKSWADEIGVPEAADQIIGSVRIERPLAFGASQPPVGEDTCRQGARQNTAASAQSDGPDVIVVSLQGTVRYTPRVGDITAFAIGTTSCNIGTARANWIRNTNQHPVIIQNVYRVDGRGFQQIGMSWLKHGFYAVSQSLCSPCNDPTNGTQLGVGCSDPYEAPLNGDQSNMSPRATLNAHTGYFPYPWSGPGWADSVARRIQIHDADLNPALNPGARYLLEGQYLMADEAAVGNSDNNASYREATVIPFQDSYTFVLDGLRPTRRGEAAVRAWKDMDPEVQETDVRVPGEGLLILAAKATAIGGGWYRYQYALQNLNSDRCARELKVGLPPGAMVENIGFHDIDHHSGEPFAITDWSSSYEGREIGWWTDTYDADQNANALRFGTAFSFSFDCNIEPAVSKIYIGLFKPGFPMELAASSIGPRPELIDCNDNSIADDCDLDCGAFNCTPPCGASIDCDDNGVPDECQQDCDGNGIADQCDIAACSPGDASCADCNGNFAPDRCDPDCNGDQIPDDCLAPPDTDGDGLDDCRDACPVNTPPGACAPSSALVTCRLPNGFCIQEISLAMCIEIEGIAVCGEPPEIRCEFGTPCITSPCRDGCLLGDCDRDADRDLDDYQVLQRCFSGSEDGVFYLPPSEECAIPLDFDGDGDIDWIDAAELANGCSGPLGN